MASNRTPTRFFGPGYVTDSATVLYTVPAGKIAVIKCITIGYIGDPDQLRLFIEGSSNPDRTIVIDVPSFPVAPFFVYTVLAEGEDLYGQSLVGATSLSATINGDLYDA